MLGSTCQARRQALAFGIRKISVGQSSFLCLLLVYISTAHGALWFIYGLVFGSSVEDGDLLKMKVQEKKRRSCDKQILEERPQLLISSIESKLPLNQSSIALGSIFHVSQPIGVLGIASVAKEVSEVSDVSF
ncbi:hypothetical protein Tco_1004381 [Tanacetum coccineum]|uniref:Uncharacterized protein n=1 Tax=Tanacetum coccineum TaxID=301880 RepID=A0ABQ5FD28_9ASTR